MDDILRAGLHERSDGPALSVFHDDPHLDPIGLEPLVDIVRLDVIDLDHRLYIAEHEVPEALKVRSVCHELYAAPYVNK